MAWLYYMIQRFIIIDNLERNYRVKMRIILFCETFITFFQSSTRIIVRKSRYSPYTKCLYVPLLSTRFDCWWHIGLLRKLSSQIAYTESKMPIFVLVLYIFWSPVKYTSREIDGSCKNIVENCCVGLSQLQTPVLIILCPYQFSFPFVIYNFFF